MPPDLQRILVVGTSGSGKTTLARNLSQRLSLPHFDIDELHWGPNWTPKPVDEFHLSLREAVAGDRWILSGNYGSVRDIHWPRATTILWLNYGFPTVFTRVFRRTVRRIISQELVCNGNRETFYQSFLRFDSVLVWSMTTYQKNRQRYAQLRADKTYPQLEWIEFRRPREAEEFLATLDNRCPSVAGTRSAARTSRRG